MRKVLLSLTAPLLSMAILTVGNGFLTTLTSLGIRQFESNAWVTGLIIASYFIGLMLGAWQTQPIVQRIGLIRAYAVFASITAVATLAQGMFADSVVWMVSRFVVGYALAGLFIVIEGWVMAATDKSNSGRVFAFYLLSYYIAQAAGQWFLRIHYSAMLMAYAVIAISASLSVLPVCLGRAPAPASESADWMPLKQLFRLAPLGWIATVVAGIVLSVIYAMYPLYLSVMSIPYGETADIMGAMILGGALLQYPLGKLSDCFDRRHVLAFSAFGTAILSLLIVLLPAHYWILLGLSFWLGGFAFTIFPLAASNTRDYTDASQAVPVMAALNILYSVGSVLGPLSSTVAMDGLGSMGLFISMGSICALLGVYALFGARRKPLHGLAGQGHFGGSVPGPGAPLSEVDLETHSKE